MPATRSASENSTVIVNLPDLKLALEVDDVLEIGDISRQDIVPMPAIAKPDNAQYLDRVASKDGRLIILLDINKLLTEAESESVKNLTEEISRQS